MTQNHTTQIPFELWLLVFEFLNNESASHLAQTCWNLHEIWQSISPPRKWLAWSWRKWHMYHEIHRDEIHPGSLSQRATLLVLPNQHFINFMEQAISKRGLESKWHTRIIYDTFDFSILRSGHSLYRKDEREFVLKRPEFRTEEWPIVRNYTIHRAMQLTDLLSFFPASLGAIANKICPMAEFRVHEITYSSPSLDYQQSYMRYYFSEKEHYSVAQFQLGLESQMVMQELQHLRNIASHSLLGDWANIQPCHPPEIEYVRRCHPQMYDTVWGQAYNIPWSTSCADFKLLSKARPC